MENHFQLQASSGWWWWWWGLRRGGDTHSLVWFAWRIENVYSSAILLSCLKEKACKQKILSTYQSIMYTLCVAITDILHPIMFSHCIVLINMRWKANIYIIFFAVQNSSIGDLVPWSVPWLGTTNNQSSQQYRVTLETCDLWDIWSEWWGDTTWPKKTYIVHTYPPT